MELHQAAEAQKELTEKEFSCIIQFDFNPQSGYWQQEEKEDGIQKNQNIGRPGFNEEV